MDVDEYLAFGRAAAIAPTANALRTIEPNGRPGTTGVPPVWAQDAQGRLLVGRPNPGGDPLDLDSLTRAGDRFRIVEVFRTEAALEAATFRKLRQDARVYAVDPVMHVLAGEARRRYPGARQIDVAPSFLYGAMEEHGFAPNAQTS